MYVYMYMYVWNWDLSMYILERYPHFRMCRGFDGGFLSFHSLENDFVDGKGVFCDAGSGHSHTQHILCGGHIVIGTYSG